MNYNQLNNLLGDLKINETKNIDASFKFSNTKSELNLNKPKKTYENITLNRNMQLNYFNNYNFEKNNPQRESLTNKTNEITNDINTNSALSRNTDLITNNFVNVNAIDYSDFSENYKDYKEKLNSKQPDFSSNGDTLNQKLSARDYIPSNTHIPHNIWN